MSTIGMELGYQLMMGLGLAACAGFRAWLPMLVMGVMARTGHITLGPSFQFLASDGALIIFGVATVLETFGDKFIAIDHFLDAVGTLVRPVAGTILASSMFTKMDPQTALVLGLIVGGGSSLTVHAGKALTRAKVTMFSPLHGGMGNAAVSLGEDVFSIFALSLWIFAPMLAGMLAVCVLCFAAGIIYLGLKAGQKIFKFLMHREPYRPPVVNAVPAM